MCPLVSLFSYNLTFTDYYILGLPEITLKSHRPWSYGQTLFWEMKTAASSSSCLCRQTFRSKAQFDPCGSMLVNYAQVWDVKIPFSNFFLKSKILKGTRHKYSLPFTPIINQRRDLVSTLKYQYSFEHVNAACSHLRNMRKRLHFLNRIQIMVLWIRYRADTGLFTLTGITAYSKNNIVSTTNIINSNYCLNALINY